MQTLRSLPPCLAAAALLFPPVQSQIIAYEIEAGTVGGQEFQGALGMDFIVNDAITVGELGVFDSGSDGLTRAITVELWSRNDGGTPDVFNDDGGDSILAFETFGVGEEGTLAGGSRFKALDSPLVLDPGAYTIVAHGYGPGEPNMNLGGNPDPRLTTADTEFISFVGGSRFGDPAANGQFPNSVDGGPENRYGAGTFSFTTEDTDGDGMPDVWEEENGLDKENPDDADEDADSDGLTNLEEFENRTDPNEEDTDGDTLSDGEEVNTTMTDPTKADSDGDGLTDEVETNTGTFVSASDTGTDPNHPNTDGDFATDGEEVEAGSDPNDPNDTPPVPFSGFLAVDYLEGAPGTQTFGEGLGHDFIVNEPIRVNALGVFDSGADGLNRTLSSEIWQRDDGGTPDSFQDDTGTMLASLLFTSADPGFLLNSNRMKSLADPLDLEPGAYTIVGRGYGAGEPNGNEGTGGPGPAHKNVDEGDGLITFVGVSRFGGGGVGVDQWPGSPDSGPVVRYSAGTFAYDVPGADLLVLRISSSGDDLVFEWNSKFGKVYDILSETDLSSDSLTWPVFEADIEAVPPLNTETIPRPDDAERFFVVVEKDAPPIFEDDFESDKGWTTGVNGANANTSWERGAPSNVGPPTGAGGSTNCFGTNLDADYGADADVWLRSPEIDLTDPRLTGAKLTFHQFKDIEQAFDFGAVRVLRASDDVQLGDDIESTVDGVTVDWEEFSGNLPPETIGETIKLEFQFVSDDLQNLAGWYIDNVEISVQ